MIDWIKPSGKPFRARDTEDNNVYLESMGFTRKIEAVISNIVVTDSTIEVTQANNAPLFDGDKGHGTIGSIEWRTQCINMSCDKKEIADFILEINGKKLDQRGSIEKVRAKAIALLEAD